MALRSSDEIIFESNRQGLGWKELIDKYLAVPKIRNSFLLIYLMGFLGFPLMAHIDVNYVGASVVPFKFIVLFMVYAQARCLFEVMLLIFLYFGGNEK